MMQTDVKVKRLTTAAGSALNNGRTRIKAIQIAAAADVALVVRDGGATSPILFTIDYTGLTNPQASSYFLLPGEGILTQNDPFFIFTGGISVSVFYG